MKLDLYPSEKPKAIDLNAEFMARRIWIWKQWKFACKNSFALGEFEADLLTVTRAHYLHEFEIKRTRADYFADFKKGMTSKQKKESEKSEMGRKHKGLKKGDLWNCPNYFWFVVPYGLIDPSEVPAHCGLIWILESGNIHEKVSAPKLHKNKADNRVLLNMLRTLTFRDFKLCGL